MIHHYLNTVETGNEFLFSNGESASSLEEFQDILCHIPKETFYNHVSEHKNDFANWVKDCVKDYWLYEQVKNAKSKNELEIVIERRLNDLKLMGDEIRKLDEDRAKLKMLLEEKEKENESLMQNLDSVEKEYEKLNANYKELHDMINVDGNYDTDNVIEEINLLKEENIRVVKENEVLIHMRELKELRLQELAEEIQRLKSEKRSLIEENMNIQKQHDERKSKHHKLNDQFYNVASEKKILEEENKALKKDLMESIKVIENMEQDFRKAQGQFIDAKKFLERGETKSRFDNTIRKIHRGFWLIEEDRLDAAQRVYKDVMKNYSWFSPRIKKILYPSCKELHTLISDNINSAKK